MSKTKMLVPATLPGVQVPEGYLLVQQIKPAPTTPQTLSPNLPSEKNWNRNQRKEQLSAGGAREPARNPGPIPPPATAETGVQPVVAQPMGSITAEAGLSPGTCTGTENGDVVIESTANHPGYQTVDYAQHRADKLAVRNKGNLSAEVMLNHVKKLVNYLYGFTKVLAFPGPGAEFEVVRMWRYANNGTTVITGGNVISVACEILFFFKIYGNPVEGDAFLTRALDCIKIHPSMIKGEFLKGWVEEQLHPDLIVAKLDSVTKSDTFTILKKFLNVLDNSGQLMARLPQSIYQSCYKFVGHNDEPRWISDAYILGTSTRFNKALNSVVKHVQNAHVPLLGVNQVNILLRGTGISLNRFTGFAQAEGRVVKERSKDDNYPSPFDLLNLCGLPLPAQYQDEENQKLMLKMELQAEENQKLREKLDHLINIQIQTS